MGLIILAPGANAGGPWTKMKPGIQISLPPPVLRYMPDSDSAPVSSNVQIPVRPTIDPAQYAAMKAAAAASRGTARPGAQNNDYSFQATTLEYSFEGLNQGNSGGLCPPDIHGAIGRTHYVEIVNSQVRVWQRVDGPDADTWPEKLGSTPAKNSSLAAFFGYFATTVFDPRVIYDRVWGRWVITAEAFPESATVQRFFLAVSTSENAAGSYLIYSFDVDFFNDGSFFDFPMLGMDQDAIIVTANRFNPGFIGCDALFLPKGLFYNGFTSLGCGTLFYAALAPSTQPPYVMDNEPATYLVSAPPGNTVLLAYLALDTSRCVTTLFGPSALDVPDYAVPPPAVQPGTGAVLDTLDNRFQNRGTQINRVVGSAVKTLMYQVHTVNIAGFPTPVYYVLNMTDLTLLEIGLFFKDGNSDDWNPAIAADDSDNIGVTWSSTDAPDGVRVHIRFSGRPSGGAPDTNGVALSTNPSANYFSCLQGGVHRWGDYAATTVDPVPHPDGMTRFWIVNEYARTVSGINRWYSRIGRGHL